MNGKMTSGGFQEDVKQLMSLIEEAEPPLLRSFQSLIAVMWILLLAARRRLRRGKNDVRVFDEASLASGDAPTADHARRGVFATTIVLARRGGGGGGEGGRDRVADTFWGTWEMSRVEMNYFMVSDSLRPLPCRSRFDHSLAAPPLPPLVEQRSLFQMQKVGTP